MPQSRATLLAIITALVALVALAALIIQFWVTITTAGIRQATAGAEVWRLFGYFTIITNIIVVFAAAAIAFRPDSILARPRGRMAVAVAIALVGIIYSVALRHQWDPKGWQAVADHGLHDAVPILFVVTWLLCGHGALKWKDAGWSMVLPVAYCAYALIRGAADGWYPYWFLDADKLGAGTLVLYIAVLSVTFLVFGFLFVGIDKLMGRDR